MRSFQLVDLRREEPERSQGMRKICCKEHALLAHNSLRKPIALPLVLCRVFLTESVGIVHNAERHCHTGAQERQEATRMYGADAGAAQPAQAATFEPDEELKGALLSFVFPIVHLQVGRTRESQLVA